MAGVDIYKAVYISITERVWLASAKNNINISDFKDFRTIHLGLARITSSRHNKSISDHDSKLELREFLNL